MKPLPYTLHAEVPAEAAEDARRQALLAVVVAANLDLPPGQSIGTTGRGRARHAVHRFAGECSTCKGTGKTGGCRRHPWAACDCTVLYAVTCGECLGDGWREEADHDCPGCEAVDAALDEERRHDDE